MLTVAAAALSAAAVVACDRPATRAIAPPADARTQAEEAAASPGSNESRTQQAAAAAPRPSPMPPADALTDTVITGRIKAALLTDPAMTGADVSVNTDHGVVALAGQVRTPEQIAIASAHAQRQDGVMRVDNHLAANTH